MTTMKNRFDLCILMDVKYSNLNGDPDVDNRPRIGVEDKYDSISNANLNNAKQ